MSSITSLTGPTTATTVPLVTPQPATPTPVLTTVPSSPVSTSSAPPLTAAQTLYDTSVQGDVDPQALLPPDFDVEAWGPAMYAHYDDDDGDFADEYTVLPMTAYYAGSSHSEPWRDDGDFEVLPWGYGTGPKSYYAMTKGKKPGGPDIVSPALALITLGVIGGVLWYNRKNIKKWIR